MEVQHTKHGCGSIVLMSPVIEDQLVRLVVLIQWHRGRAGWYWWNDPAIRGKGWRAVDLQKTQGKMT